MKTEVSTGVGAGEGAGGPHGSWVRAMESMWGVDAQGKSIWRFITEGTKEIPGIPLNLWEIQGVMGVQGRWEVKGVFLRTGKEEKYRAMTGLINSRCGNGNPKARERKFANIGYSIHANEGIMYRLVEPKMEPKSAAQIAEEKLAQQAEELRLVKEKLDKLEKQAASEPKPPASTPSNSGRPSALPSGAAARAARAKAEQEAKEKAEREAKEREESPL